jgi:hypothetical protein
MVTANQLGVKWRIKARGSGKRLKGRGMSRVVP